MLNFKTVSAALLISSSLLSMTLTSPVLAMEEQEPEKGSKSSFPKFSRYDRKGNRYRHFVQLQSDLQEQVDLNKLRGIHHPVLEKALEELKGFETHPWIDREEYTKFLEENEGLFSSYQIHVKDIPTSISETFRPKIGIFRMPIRDNERYLSRIHNQLSTIQDNLSDMKIVKPSVTNLLNELATVDKRKNSSLEDFLKKNHARLFDVGVCDPRDQGFKEHVDVPKSTDCTVDTSWE